jgi:hypothetical protein
MLLNPRTSLARRSRRSQEAVEEAGVVEEAVPEAVVVPAAVDVAVAVVSRCTSNAVCEEVSTLRAQRLRSGNRMLQMRLQ